MKVFMYGESFSGDGSMEKFIFDQEDVEMAIALSLFNQETRHSQDDFEDEWIDSMHAKYGVNATGLNDILYADFPLSVFVSWVHTHTIGLFSEDGMHGIALTKEGAKSAYLKIKEENEGEEHWGDEDDEM
jgi:hypothetical protein